VRAAFERCTHDHYSRITRWHRSVQCCAPLVPFSSSTSSTSRLQFSDSDSKNSLWQVSQFALSLYKTPNLRKKCIPWRANRSRNCTKLGRIKERIKVYTLIRDLYIFTLWTMKVSKLIFARELFFPRFISHWQSKDSRPPSISPVCTDPTVYGNVAGVSIAGTRLMFKHDTAKWIMKYDYTSQRSPRPWSSARSRANNDGRCARIYLYPSDALNTGTRG